MAASSGERRRPTRLWTCLLAAGLLAGVGSAAGSRLSASPSQIDLAAQRLALWRGPVEAHVAGSADPAVEQLARWDYEDLLAVLPQVSELKPPERLRLVRRALVAHTDVAIAHKRPSGYALPPYGGSIQVFADGQVVGESAATFHWDFARALIERLPRGDDRSALATTFYRASSALLLQWASHIELDQHLEGASRVIGRDPVLALYEGIRHQIYAHPRAKAYFDELRRVTPRGAPFRLVPPVVNSIDGMRERAERAFRRALDGESGLHEARIRLAHVLLDRGRHAQALDQVDDVPVEALRPDLAYYALVLRGMANRALDRFENARLAFEGALTLVPDAQIPRLGLSEMALASGDRGTASVLLLAIPPVPDEPWWELGRPFVAVEEVVRDMWKTLG